MPRRRKPELGQAHDNVVEQWLRGKVGLTYDAMKASPARVVAAKTVRGALAKAHKRAKRS